jgi:hypothetical protein
MIDDSRAQFTYFHRPGQILLAAAIVALVFSELGYAGILAIIVLFTLAASGWLFYTLVFPRLVGGFVR